MVAPFQLLSPVWPRSGQNCRSPLLSFSWWRWKIAEWGGQADQGTEAGGRLRVDPACTALAFIITHSLSATFPYSVTLCLFSILLRSPFILDLLSWLWWVSLYDMELSVRNTKQNWDRFSTLHRSLWRIAPFCQVHCATRSFCCPNLLCVFDGTLWAHTSAQIVCFSF